MKTIARFGSIIAIFALLGTLAVAAPKTERAKKYFDVAGKVIQIDQKDRTLLVKDRKSNLYEIRVPEGATFKQRIANHDDIHKKEDTLNDNPSILGPSYCKSASKACSPSTLFFPLIFFFLVVCSSVVGKLVYP